MCGCCPCVSAETTAAHVKGASLLVAASLSDALLSFSDMEDFKSLLLSVNTLLFIADVYLTIVLRLKESAVYSVIL